MSALLESFFTMVERGPLGLWAFLTGLVISWGVMLRIRTWQSSRVSLHARQFVGHFLGFAAAVAATWAVWPSTYGLLTGIAVGLFGPWSWEVFLLALEWKWPQVAAKLRTPA